jgi:hypothetical protein
MKQETGLGVQAMRKKYIILLLFSIYIVGLSCSVHTDTPTATFDSIPDKYEVIINQKVELYSVLTREYAVFTTVYVRDKLDKELLTMEYSAATTCMKDTIPKVKAIELKKAMVIKRKVQTSLIEVYK